MKDTLLSYSGGLDSSSALHIYKDRIAMAISFHYGSNHNDQEIRMAKLNCERLGIPHKVIDLKNVFEGMKSALLGEGHIPEGHYEDETMKATVVPFRNGVFLSILTAIAEDLNLSYVMLASHSGDNAVYNDCRPEFNKPMSEAMQAGTSNNITISAPFESIGKPELAQLGIAAGMVPDQTYSCYVGEDTPCGECSTCRERDWALGLRKEP